MTEDSEADLDTASELDGILLLFSVCHNVGNTFTRYHGMIFTRISHCVALSL